MRAKVRFVTTQHLTNGDVLAMRVSGILSSGRDIMVLEWDPNVWAMYMPDEGSPTKKILEQVLFDKKATGLVRIV